MFGSREAFLNKIKECNNIADDTTLSLKERVHALAELYFVYQHDVHMQARTVRRIEELTA